MNIKVPDNNSAKCTYAAWATAKHISSSRHLCHYRTEANGLNNTGITDEESRGFFPCPISIRNIISTHWEGDVGIEECRMKSLEG